MNHCSRTSLEEGRWLVGWLPRSHQIRSKLVERESCVCQCVSVWVCECVSVDTLSLRWWVRDPTQPTQGSSSFAVNPPTASSSLTLLLFLSIQFSCFDPLSVNLMKKTTFLSTFSFFFPFSTSPLFSFDVKIVKHLVSQSKLDKNFSLS